MCMLPLVAYADLEPPDNSTYAALPFPSDNGTDRFGYHALLPRHWPTSTPVKTTAGRRTTSKKRKTTSKKRKTTSKKRKTTSKKRKTTSKKRKTTSRRRKTTSKKRKTTSKRKTTLLGQATTSNRKTTAPGQATTPAVQKTTLVTAPLSTTRAPGPTTVTPVQKTTLGAATTLSTTATQSNSQTPTASATQSDTQTTQTDTQTTTESQTSTSPTPTETPTTVTTSDTDTATASTSLTTGTEAPCAVTVASGITGAALAVYFTNASLAGKVICLQAGNYSLFTPISLFYGVTVRGAKWGIPAGPSSTPADRDPVNFVGESVIVTNSATILANDTTIDGVAWSTSSTSSSLIVKAARARIVNCIFVGRGNQIATTGVYFSIGTEAGEVPAPMSLYVANSYLVGGRYGISISGNNLTTDSSFIGNYIARTERGIAVQSSTIAAKFLISGNLIEAVTLGMRLLRDGHTIVGNTIRNLNLSVALQATMQINSRAYATPLGLTIINNQLSGGMYGIFLQDLTNDPSVPYTISENSITGFTEQSVAHVSSNLATLPTLPGSTVNATNNWWGNSGGLAAGLIYADTGTYLTTPFIASYTSDLGEPGFYPSGITTGSCTTAGIPFDGSSIPSVEAWWDAAQLSSIVSSSSLVSSWMSLTVAETTLTQGTSGKLPLLTGGGVRFDQTAAQFLQATTNIPLVMSYDVFTMVVVFSCDSTAGTQSLLYQSGGAAATGTFAGFTLVNGKLYFSGQGNDADFSDLAACVPGQKHIGVISIKAPGSLASMDGVISVQAGPSAALTIGVDYIYMGLKPLYNNEPFGGTIFEAIVTSQYLLDGDRWKVEGYLANKYSIALPTGHPFKTCVPMA
jgi:hypothetical protein